MWGVGDERMDVNGKIQERAKKKQQQRGVYCVVVGGGTNAE